MSIVNVRLLYDGEASYSVKDDRRYRVVFRVRTSTVNDTPYDVLASSALPVKVGYPYAGWVRQPNGAYLANSPSKDPDCVCVFIEPKRLEDDPQTYDVTFTFEGVKSVLAVPAEIEYEDVPYQEQQVQDIHGLLKTNSALDPYEEGTDVDRNRLRLVITRNVPYGAWDPDFVETFKNTLNQAPYLHGGLGRPVFDEDGNPVLDEFGFPVFDPVTSPAGTAKLTGITARRLVRLQNPLPEAARYYWQVRAVIDFDYSKFTDNNGIKQLRRWRRVLIDAGYKERINGGARPILGVNGGHVSGGPTLLDGAGRRLFLHKADPDDASRVVFDPDHAPTLAVVTRTGTDPDAAVPEHDWYACRQGTKLTVAAPGVMANDHVPLGATAELVDDVAHGAVELDEDGGFVYTSEAALPPPPPPPPPPEGGTLDPVEPPFVGWVTFTYKLVYPTGESNPATVCILVGPVPRVRVFEDYEFKDWSPIAGILSGW